MIKHVSIITVLLVLIATVLPSCTQNDGNIGDWFGHWKLLSVTVNGEKNEEYEGNIFFSFQSSVFCQIKVSPNHGGDHKFAIFKDEGEYISVTFSTDRYQPFAETMMKMGENVLHVDKLDGNDLQLSMNLDNGQTVVYKLEKW